MKKTMNLNKLKTNQAVKITKVLSERLNKKEAKKGVDLVSLAKDLAKRHIDKIKVSSDEESEE
jgi:hypothetical protein